jgi:hypothetical protein
MAIVGLHARFEPFLAMIASVVTCGHIRAFSTEKIPENVKFGETENHFACLPDLVMACSERKLENGQGQIMNYISFILV